MVRSASFQSFLFH